MNQNTERLEYKIEYGRKYRTMTVKRKDMPWRIQEYDLKITMTKTYFKKRTLLMEVITDLGFVCLKNPYSFTIPHTGPRKTSLLLTVSIIIYYLTNRCTNIFTFLYLLLID